MKLFSWLSNLIPSVKILCLKRKQPLLEKFKSKEPQKPTEPQKPKEARKSQKPLQNRKKKKKSTTKENFFCNNFIANSENLPPENQNSDPSTQTYLIHERMSVNFKKLCLNRAGIVYDSAILKVCARIRLKKDLKTLKVQFHISNISEHTEITLLELNLRSNPDIQVVKRRNVCEKLEVDGKTTLSIEILPKQMPFQTIMAILSSQWKKLTFAVTFFMPITLFLFKLPIKNPEIPPKPQDFWPRLKKIRFSDEWFDYEGSLFPKEPQKILELFKGTWGFKSCWLKNYEIYGVLVLYEMEIYYHIEIKEKKKRMKVLVGYLDKENTKGDMGQKGMRILDHVFESFYYIFLENQGNVGI